MHRIYREKERDGWSHLTCIHRNGYGCVYTLGFYGCCSSVSVEYFYDIIGREEETVRKTKFDERKPGCVLGRDRFNCCRRKRSSHFSFDMPKYVHHTVKTRNDQTTTM